MRFACRVKMPYYILFGKAIIKPLDKNKKKCSWWKIMVGNGYEQFFVIYDFGNVPEEQF